MQIKHKLNHSLFTFAQITLLFIIFCPLAQAQTSPNEIVFVRYRDVNFNSSEIFTMKADGSNQINLINSAMDNDIFPDWSPDGKIVAAGGVNDSDVLYD